MSPLWSGYDRASLRLIGAVTPRFAHVATRKVRDAELKPRSAATYAANYGVFGARKGLAYAQPRSRRRRVGHRAVHRRAACGELGLAGALGGWFVVDASPRGAKQRNDSCSIAYGWCDGICYGCLSEPEASRVLNMTSFELLLLLDGRIRMCRSVNVVGCRAICAIPLTFLVVGPGESMKMRSAI